MASYLSKENQQTTAVEKSLLAGTMILNCRLPYSLVVHLHIPRREDIPRQLK